MDKSSFAKAWTGWYTNQTFIKPRLVAGKLEIMLFKEIISQNSSNGCPGKMLHWGVQVCISQNQLTDTRFLANKTFGALRPQWGLIHLLSVCQTSDTFFTKTKKG